VNTSLAAPDPVTSIAAELRLPPRGVATVVKLIGEGATVPFIARYRKEATGGLDELQIRAVSERHEYLIELGARRASVIAEIEKQGKMTPELAARLHAAETKGQIEDLYLPYKPKRRTRAAIAIERGLEPLAQAMWNQVAETPATLAARFVDAKIQVPDVAAALAGARDVCAERLADDAELRRHLRDVYQREAVVRVKKKQEFGGKPTKFDTYAEYGERAASLPSHRYLAIARGEAEGVLKVAIDVDLEAQAPRARARIPLRKGSAWAAELELVVADALKRLVAPAIASDLRADLKQRSDEQAIRVFAQNLRELLLAAPFGPKAVIGIDPGQRTGAKCAVVDETGRLVAHDTIYLVQGAGALDRAKVTLRGLLARHRVRAVAVGNGTHGRETEAFARDVVRESGLTEPPVVVSVNEAGASVYSASEIARSEFPELDLTVRGAISIARRLQDPLAELVKIDPKSIGVGQYQHDVAEARLGRELDDVVESCVNGVGVELNTASAPLLARVAGLGPALARRIVEHRDRSGRFESRQALRKVTGLGPKTFEQAAGFLRIGGAKHPLDASAVHPERYALVERMARELGVPLTGLIGNAEALKRLDPSRYKSDDVGDFTLSDIVAELHKPGRDPRKSFEPPRFREDVRKLTDLAQGMELEGVVTNVTAFGAFVDVGVHQDGLVHISQLADRFVKDPHEVVKVGDKLKVRVLSVDLDRKRIALSAKRK
jgi:protein Tex